MTTFISARFEQLAYFDRQLGGPDWAGLRVLDFGGNAGNLLASPACAIDHRRYWCLDVSRDAIELGGRRYPGAHFVHYDRYNPEFNQSGVHGLAVPDLGQRFDVILAWSVFTHISRAETVALVGELEALLAPGGVLAFTFIDPYFDPPPGWARHDDVPGLDNLRWRLDARRRFNPTVEVEALASRAGDGITWATLVDDDELHLDPDDEGTGGRAPRAYLTLCTEAEMRSLFPRGEVLAPVPPERQSCCVIRERAAPGA